MSHTFNPPSEAENRLVIGQERNAGNEPCIKEQVTRCMILFPLVTWEPFQRSVTLPNEDSPQKGDSWAAVHDSGTDEKLQRPPGVRGELCHIIKASSQPLLPCHISQCGVMDGVSVCWMSADSIKCCVSYTTDIRSYFSSRTCNYKKMF